MRKHLFLLAAVLVAAACSSPKYTYNFDYYDYNSGKKQKLQHTLAQSSPSSEEVSPLALNEDMLTASASETPVVLAEPPAPATVEEARENLANTYKAMTKAEQKAFKKELKKEIKTYVKAAKKSDTINADKSTQALDRDLKFAIIFGVIGLVFGIAGIWVVSTIAWIVALVFLILWLVRQ